MDRRRFTQPLCWRLIAIGLGLLSLGAIGCDDLDASVVLSTPANSAEAPESATPDSDRNRKMESVGPEKAMRIYYQFIDDHGRVQFVERLSDVPAAWRAQVGYVEMSQPPPMTPQQARQTWQISADRAAEIKLGSAARSSSRHDLGSQRESVVLYFATWCGYCTKARAHLDAEGIRYDLRDVDIDAVGRELRQKTGRGGIPVLDFSGEILRGYNADAYDKAIRTIRG